MRTSSVTLASAETGSLKEREESIHDGQKNRRDRPAAIPRAGTPDEGLDESYGRPDRGRNCIRGQLVSRSMAADESFTIRQRTTPLNRRWGRT
jgi:hypothetical protein